MEVQWILLLFTNSFTYCSSCYSPMIRIWMSYSKGISQLPAEVGIKRNVYIAVWFKCHHCKYFFTFIKYSCKMQILFWHSLKISWDRYKNVWELHTSCVDKWQDQIVICKSLLNYFFGWFIATIPLSALRPKSQKWHHRHYTGICCGDSLEFYSPLQQVGMGKKWKQAQVFIWETVSGLGWQEKVKPRS